LSPVEISLPDGRPMKAVLGVPSGQSVTGGWPAVIVLYEVFGMTPEMIDVADRCARNRYLALVPDLFSVGPRLLCVARAMVESSLGRPGTTTARVEAARLWLCGRPDVDDRRLGVIGFCMGGGFALAYATTGPDGVGAVSVNYGQVPRDLVTLRRACPIVASYGARDLVYGRQGKRLAKALATFGVESDVKVYDEAGHSFLTDGHHPVGRLVFFPMRLGYHRAAADDAWQRIFAFFDRHVAGR
jgi:carboxymethylenebutenolidase